MVAKTKPMDPASAEALEQIVAKGTEAMKDNFEKAMGNFDKLTTFSKQTMEAFVQSAQAASKGIEALNSEALAYSRHAVEDSVAAAKAILSARSVQELIELNTDYSKTAFDQYVGQVTKFSDMIASTAKQAVNPINSRFNAFVQMVQPRA